jgi:adenylate cyclase
MKLAELKNDVSEEVSTILSSDFAIEVTNTQTVPQSSDGAITFPNLDNKSQGTKLIESTVLYVDMRRSTQLSLQHRRHTVAKLYSAFVRAMTRCAGQFGGEVRGIIGDRVMIIFNSGDCFTAAVDTAILINSVCSYVINKHFVHNEVTFGIGIDYGRMLATKTGIRRHGAAQQSYRSLVWLGRPANIASKLTDNANKEEETIDLVIVNVAYLRGGQLVYFEEIPHLLVNSFTYDPLRRLMVHRDPTFHSFHTITRKHVTKAATPSILMTKRVYDGFRQARPNAPCLANGWFAPVNLRIPGYTEQAYGGNVIYTLFKG